MPSEATLTIMLVAGGLLVTMLLLTVMTAVARTLIKLVALVSGAVLVGIVLSVVGVLPPLPFDTASLP